MKTAVRLSVLLLSPLLLAQAPAPKAPPPDHFAEKRAELLRAMADLRAKLQSLETELQILEEQRQQAAQSAPATPGADWRSSPAAAPLSSHGSPDPPAVKAVKARCQGITTAGKRCTRSAEPGSKFCWQHRH